jgi:beta-glucosidase
LTPGETRTIAFDIDVQDLAFHNAALERVAEPGSFTVFVGGNSSDTKQLRFSLETTDGRPVRVAATCEAVR